MKLPIVPYGHPLLRQRGEEVTPGFPQLPSFIANMWETMYNAKGCGLAAVQVGKAIRLFIVDSVSTYNNLAEEDRDGYFANGDTGIKETFINARILERSDEIWKDEEGCLSIPGISQQVTRPWSITIEYLDAGWNRQVKTYRGATARMIQHEYDHTEGVLYLDYLRPLDRKLLQAKLKRIASGQVSVHYPMMYK